MIVVQLLVWSLATLGVVLGFSFQFPSTPVKRTEMVSAAIVGKDVGFFPNTNARNTRCSSFRDNSIAQSSARDYIDRGSYWVYMYYLLMVYKDHEGHCRVPFSHVEDGWKLGHWLSDQRQSQRAETLDSIRRMRLEEAGVIWDPQEYQWSHMFELLQGFQNREGHCHVSQTHMEGGRPLGTWVSTQRKLKKAGKMNANRQRQLEDLGVMWDAFAWKWERMFALLLKFKTRTGHCNVPIRQIEEGENLGMWLMTQRKLKRAGTLNPDRQLRLDEEAGVECVIKKSEQWFKMLALLVEFKNREGHSNVLQKHKEGGENLGTWLANQRRDKLAGALVATRQEHLENIGVVWDPISMRWERMLSLVLQFRDREGRCSIPQSHVEDGVKIGVWLKNQRAAKIAGRLNIVREEKLEKIGVKFNSLAGDFKRESHENR